ncbi:MAG: porin, partial [Bacteroidota bacterium]
MKTIIHTNYIKNIILLAIMLVGAATFAQDDEEEEGAKFSFSGSVDAYYRANFNGLNKEVPVLDAT